MSGALVVLAVVMGVASFASLGEMRRTLDFVAVALAASSLVVRATGSNTWLGLFRRLPAGGSQVVGLPPSAATADERLAKSPRHRQDVMIPTAGVPDDSVHAWVFYPEVSGKAPVVVVIHEIFGVSNWIKGVGDQLAAEGFIAVVPDLLYGKHLPGAPDNVPHDVAMAAIRTLDPATVQRDIDVAANYGTHLSAAMPVYGVVGYCWGGGVSFAHAVHASPPGSPPLKAAVVYYGTAPDVSELASARAPVLGLYGGNDARVSGTVPGTDSAMRQLHKTYETRVYEGAGHAFLRAQEDAGGANAAATRDAWPRTVQWFRRYLHS